MDINFAPHRLPVSCSPGLRGIASDQIDQQQRICTPHSLQSVTVERICRWRVM
jgi:hypothetical protein